MKARINMLLGAITVLMTLVIANCGSNGGGTSAATPAIGSVCGTNMLQSQYGCLAACSSSSVLYNGACTPITGYGIQGYGGGATSLCQGGCTIPGTVQVSGQCLPQGSCGNPCYGQYGGYCYIGDYAHQVLGY